MGKFFAWMFAAAIVIGACTNALESVDGSSTTTTTIAPVTTTTLGFADPLVPVPVEGSGTHSSGSSSGSTSGSTYGDPSEDEIDCSSPEDAIDDGWDEEDVLDYCGMDDSELEEDYQDW